MTADDVVATFDRLANPDNGSNALSVFTGMLSKGGTRKVDDHTVEFHLDAASRSWLAAHLPDIADPLTRGGASRARVSARRGPRACARCDARDRSSTAGD